MIILEGRAIDEQGQVWCDTPTLREVLYKSGSWPTNTKIIDSHEQQLYTQAQELCAHSWNQQQSFDWFTPEPWQSWDVESWCRQQCKSSQELARCNQELDLYMQGNLIPMLRHLKYILDGWRNNNTVWGVGRGSSISSYVLYLLGVHKINPLSYNLDYQEFFKTQGVEHGKSS
tara:strand:- start:5238 stop:5756 length:519 start_codon:yes stop_codon:yes gene_type:complete